MADTDLSRRALLTRAAIIAPLVLTVGAVALPTPGPSTAAWDAALARYRRTRDALEAIPGDTPEWDDAIEIHCADLNALMGTSAPTIAHLASKLRIAQFENLAEDLPESFLADLDRLSA